MEKPVAGRLCLYCLNFHWKGFFFESKDTGVFKDVRNKLFANNEKQIDNHVLMLYMLPS